MYIIWCYNNNGDDNNDDGYDDDDVVVVVILVARQHALDKPATSSKATRANVNNYKQKTIEK